MTEFRVGCHLSSAKGFLAMGREAVRIGANTFQFFTRNPRGGAVKALDEKDAAAYRAFAQENSLYPMLAHAPYTLNCCGKDEAVRDFAARVLREDLMRLSHFPGSMYNLHPGSHVGQGVQVGVRLIAEALDAALEDVGDAALQTHVLLETMAGKGSEVGATFEQLAKIIETMRFGDRIGVCLDTCHVYDAGYDIVEDLDGVLAQFDRTLGLARLRAIHANDSKHPMGSHKDRHEKIGLGSIGQAGFKRLLHCERLREVPVYLETPQENMDGYAKEIALLRRLRDEA